MAGPVGFCKRQYNTGELTVTGTSIHRVGAGTERKEEETSTRGLVWGTGNLVLPNQDIKLHNIKMLLYKDG